MQYCTSPLQFNREDYTNAKTEFIMKITEAAKKEFNNE